jgi:hypothetical protein
MSGRSVRLCFGPPGVIVLTNGDEADTYVVTTEPPHDGDPARPAVVILERVNPDGTLSEPYRVSSAGCTCPGFVHRGACKHAEAIKALRRAGKL